MTNPYFEFTKRYWPVFFTHGFIRKTYQMYDAKVHNYSYKKEEAKDLYYTTKFGIIVFGTCLNMIYWPITIIKDIHSIEGYIRGDVEENPKALPVDYLFDL